jgi:cell division protein FtsB
MAYSKKVEKHRFGYMMGSILIFIAIVYLFFNMLDGWHKYQESTKRLEASTASLVELTKQHEDLEKEKALEISSTGYERHVRSEFNLTKPDEKVVFISSEEAPAPIPEEKGIQKIIHTFKNFFN